MKAALNSSARDAQIRDSFNKESFGSVTSDQLCKLCNILFNLQKELPRNASKLHSLVVVDDSGTPVYLMNFEILRSSVSITTDEKEIGRAFNEMPIYLLKDKVRTKSAKETNEKEVKENDN